MTSKDRAYLGSIILRLMSLSQWACSENWQEIEETADKLIRLINKEQNK